MTGSIAFNGAHDSMLLTARALTTEFLQAFDPRLCPGRGFPGRPVSFGTGAEKFTLLSGPGREVSCSQDDHFH